MAQASRRLRRERRVKRERSLLRRAVGYQQGQLQTVVGLLRNTQAELRALKPVPSMTIRTLTEDENYAPVDDSPFIEPDYSEPVEETNVSTDPAIS